MLLDSPDDDIAAWLRTRSRRTVLPHADRSRPLLASAAQQRLWFDHQLRAQEVADGGTVYHSTLVLRLREELDVAALGAAVEELVTRHESLRTRFVLAPEDGLRQLVDEASSVELQVEDCGGSFESQRARMAEFFAVGFDLEQGPLLRAGLFTLTPRDHTFFLVVHHIVTDGWSMDLLHRELAALYQAQRGGTVPVAPELLHQYVDFATWERSEFNRGAFAYDLEYWQQQLAGAPQVIQFPTDLPRPAERTFAAGCHRFEVPAPTMSGLERLAKHCEASMFQVLLAAYQLLLARWSSQPDLIVGSVSANRRSAETEPIVGLFVNLLPLRGRIDESESFARLVARTRDTVLDGYDHQGVSFDRLVEATASTRAPGHNPLVQTVFTLAEPVPGTEPAWGERLEFQDTTRTQFDLTFSASRDASGRLLVDAHYAADLFTADTVERLARRFTALLAKLTARPDQPLALVTTVTAQEAAELDLLATGASGAGTPLVLDLFERQVREHPDREAVVDGGTRLTYAQLDAHVDQIAQLISARRLAYATPVGVCLPRSASQIAALLGVLRAGAVYLPLDPGYPAERLAHLLRDSGSPLVLTDAATRAVSNDWPSRVELLDVSADAPAARSDAAPQVCTEQPACLIYTSGSTGQPKGVLVSHEGIGSFVSWYVEHYSLTTDDRLAQLASISFDAGLLDTLPALAAGACLTVFPDEARLEPARLWTRLADAGVTVAFLTTPLFAAAGLPSCPTALRSVQIGGDSLTHVPSGLPFTLDNLYGPTEATIAASCGRLEAGQAVHIGGPLLGMRLRVLDERLRPVPVGTPGELFVAGPGVALGYLGRPGLTAGRFLPDPWAEDGGRMYRTSDRVRWRAGGQLEYLGRTDAQMKLRGHRIEPGEIESVLGSHPDVTEAAVRLHTSSGGELLLCAYVCLRPGADSPEAVRVHVERTLPAWMHPAAYTVLPGLPLTANGKVDRAALPEPAFRTALAFRAPAGPIEELVAEVWQEVLGVNQVGADDDFFRVGGHSLLATRVVSRLTDATGCQLPLRTVFDHPVLADLAHELEDAIVAAATAGGEGLY